MSNTIFDRLTKWLSLFTRSVYLCAESSHLAILKCELTITWNAAELSLDKCGFHVHRENHRTNMKV